MAVTLRGTQTGTSLAGAPITVNMPAGTVEGDVCYVLIMSNSTADRIFTEASGTWAKLIDLYTNGSSGDVNCALFRKVMGAVPNTSITVSIDAGSSAMAGIAISLDGADLSNPEDVAVQSATGIGASDPDCPSITPITPGAWALALAASSEVDVVSNAPAGYSNLVNLIHTSNINLMFSTKEVAVAAPEDPAAYADIAADATDSWVALTVAVRPASVSVSGGVSRMTLLGSGGAGGGSVGGPPDPEFLLFDEFRIGDVSMHGFVDLLVIYESAMVRPGDADTDPPNAAYLDGFFQDLRADVGDVRISLDYEAWDLVASSGSATGINLTILQYYITLVNAARNHFSDVGLYGELSERYTGFLTGGADNPTRLANWKARAQQMQPLWDVVTTIYPSFYFINPVDDNESQRDLWYTENLSLIHLRAPGKLVIPFMWPRIHSSVNPAIPYVPGPYWRSSLESLRSLGYDGFAGWMQAGDVDPRTLNPVPAWWNETVDFTATV